MYGSKFTSLLFGKTAHDYLQVVQGNPRVWWEVLQVGYEVLDAPVPVAQQDHAKDEIQYVSYGPGRAHCLQRNVTP
jgi:hypothetical protein